MHTPACEMRLCAHSCEYFYCKIVNSYLLKTVGKFPVAFLVQEKMPGVKRVGGDAVVVVGGGGREHALCRGLLRSPLVTRVFALPGNAGTAAMDGVLNVTGTPASPLSPKDLPRALWTGQTWTRRSRRK